MADYDFTKLVKYPEFLEAKRHCFPREATDELKVFKVLLYVRQFRADEITVKVVDSHLIIHGKHEEHVDLHGFVSREFKWKYLIPDEYDPRSTSTSLIPGGVLKVFVYRKDHWAKFLSGNRKFVEYINLSPFVFRNFSFKIEAKSIFLNAMVKGNKEFNMEDFEINDEYLLPSDVDPDSVIVRLTDKRMLEVRGRRLPPTKTLQGMETEKTTQA